MATPVYAIKITSGDGTSVVVDLTNYNPTVDVDMKNPVRVLSLPAPGTASATAYSNCNTTAINLKMLATYITITFTTKDGYGENPYNLSSLTTIFQKLTKLGMLDNTKKRLYLNTTSNYNYCQFVNYSATNIAGQKDLIRHSLQVVLVGTKSQ